MLARNVAKQCVHSNSIDLIVGDAPHLHKIGMLAYPKMHTALKLVTNLNNFFFVLFGGHLSGCF